MYQIFNGSMNVFLLQRCDLRGDPLHDSTETENQNKNRESKEVQRGLIA